MMQVEPYYALGKDKPLIQSDREYVIGDPVSDTQAQSVMRALKVNMNMVMIGIWCILMSFPPVAPGLDMSGQSSRCTLLVSSAGSSLKDMHAAED